MVPQAAAQSSAVGSPASPARTRRPRRPLATGSSPQSTTTWSIATRPAIRRRRPPQPHLADRTGGPRDAVGVAERDQRQRGLRRGAVRQSVRDAVVRGHPLGQRHGAAQGHRRPQPGRGEHRVDAVQADAAPAQVEEGVRVVEHRRACWPGDAIGPGCPCSPRGRAPPGRPAVCSATDRSSGTSALARWLIKPATATRPDRSAAATASSRAASRAVRPRCGRARCRSSRGSAAGGRPTRASTASR